jgi:hypothetical protein
MTQPSDSPLLIAAADLVTALAEMQVSPTIIGGVAVSLVAQPRYTGDLDALMVFDTANVQYLIDTLERHGFRPRSADIAQQARRLRVALVMHDRTGSMVDIALGCMPFETEVQERSTPYDLSGITVRLATPEDLVIMKAIAGRPKDLEDIRTIVRVYPDLDRGRIRFWVEQFAEVLENPGLWAEVEALLDGE